MDEIFSPGDSIVEFLAPKREITKEKIDSIKSIASSTPLVRKVTRLNPEPNANPYLSNLKILLRRSKTIQDWASSSNGKAIP